MCRNIKTLYNFDPPATQEEIQAASLQFVRKITGTRNPSKYNQKSFKRAISEISDISSSLLQSLQTTVTPRNREIEAEKRKIKSAQRFNNSQS